MRVVKKLPEETGNGSFFSFFVSTSLFVFFDHYGSLLLFCQSVPVGLEHGR